MFSSEIYMSSTDEEKHSSRSQLLAIHPPNITSSQYSRISLLLKGLEA